MPLSKLQILIAGLKVFLQALATAEYNILSDKFKKQLRSEKKKAFFKKKKLDRLKQKADKELSKSPTSHGMLGGKGEEEEEEETKNMETEVPIVEDSERVSWTEIYYKSKFGEDIMDLQFKAK